MWVEDRRYPSKDGERWVVVSRRQGHPGYTDGWKTEVRSVKKEDRARFEAAKRAAGDGVEVASSGEGDHR
jgi:hypothetical protein